MIRPPSTASNWPVMKPEQGPAQRNHRFELLIDEGAGIWTEEIPQSVGAGCLHRRRQSVDGDFVGSPGAGRGSRPRLHRAFRRGVDSRDRLPITASEEPKLMIRPPAPFITAYAA
jgi:hypothetical protein